MTTETEDNVFIDDFLIAETSVSEVYGMDFDKIFHVRSKLFGKDFIARAYTEKMNIDIPTGWIHFMVKWKDGRCRDIRRPFHCRREGVLYAMKRYKHVMSDSFALNHELFALEWDSSVILHFYEGKPYIFIASREEWMSMSVPGQQNEELQVFMQVPDYRRLPLSMIPQAGASWLEECIAQEREWND